MDEEKTDTGVSLDTDVQIKVSTSEDLEQEIDAGSSEENGMEMAVETKGLEENGAESENIKTDLKVSMKKEPSEMNKPENLSDANSDVTVDYDSEDNVTCIVMNENTKFNARVKPDTSTYINTCTKCDAAFKWPFQLKNHISVIHEGKHPYECKICGKKFEHRKSFRDHKYVHTDERPFVCKLCPSTYKMKGALTQHIRDSHSQQLKFKCEYCAKVFKSKTLLVRHFHVHKEGNIFPCEICGKKFTRKNYLKEHQIIHASEKRFECPECGMKFSRKYSMKVHQRNHMEVRPFKCEFCVKSFSQSHALKSHMRLHTGERPFSCRYCERSFKQVGTLQVHEKRHKGEKNYTCGICEKAFVIHRLLKDHMRLHTGETPFECDLCPYKGKTSSGLRCHKNTHERQLQRRLKAENEEILQAVLGAQDSFLQEESILTKPKNKRSKVVKDVDKVPVKAKRPKRVQVASGEKNVKNKAHSFVDGIQRTLKIKQGKKKKVKQSNLSAADRRLFYPMLENHITDTNVGVINAQLVKDETLGLPKIENEAEFSNLSHFEQNQKLLNLLSKSHNNGSSQTNGVQQNLTLPREKIKSNAAFNNQIKKDIPSSQSLTLKSLFGKGNIEKQTNLSKQNMFAKALLGGPGTSLSKPNNVQESCIRSVHDIMNNDLSVLDQAIANLARNIGKHSSTIKVEPPDSISDPFNVQAITSGETGSILHDKVNIKLETDTYDNQASQHSDTFNVPTRCSESETSNNVQEFTNGKNTDNSIPDKVSLKLVLDFGDYQIIQNPDTDNDPSGNSESEQSNDVKELSTDNNKNTGSSGYDEFNIKLETDIDDYQGSQNSDKDNVLSSN